MAKTSITRCGAVSAGAKPNVSQLMVEQHYLGSFNTADLRGYQVDFTLERHALNIKTLPFDVCLYQLWKLAVVLDNMNRHLVNHFPPARRYGLAYVCGGGAGCLVATLE